MLSPDVRNTSNSWAGENTFNPHINPLDIKEDGLLCMSRMAKVARFTMVGSGYHFS
jgi:hypothetical protein